MIKIMLIYDLVFLDFFFPHHPHLILSSLLILSTKYIHVSKHFIREAEVIRVIWTKGFIIGIRFYAAVGAEMSMEVHCHCI